MTDTRVYLPSSPTLLRQALAAGGVGPARVHAVTAAVRRELAGGGQEEWEHAASSAAAQASLALLGPDDPARRVVLALDVPLLQEPADTYADPEDATVAELPDAVPLRRLSAVLADGPDAEPVVALARGSGDPDACAEHELGWWAAQEAEQLLEELFGSSQP